MKKKRQKELFRLKFINGLIHPDDGWTDDRLKSKYRNGDVFLGQFKMLRHPGFNRHVHGFCRLVGKNIDTFKQMDAHKILKTIQIDGDIYCENVRLEIPRREPVEYRIPESIAFDNMDEGEFRELFQKLCNYIAETYWHECTAEQVMEMARKAA